MIELDRIDLRILAELLSDARASQIELAEKVGLSPTACARRIRQLEEAGIIRGYRADLDHVLTADDIRSIEASDVLASRVFGKGGKSAEAG